MRLVVFSLVFLLARSGITGFEIKIDAQKDPFYDQLTGPENGFLTITPDDFLPISGPRPNNDRDLSGEIWMAWDSVYFYVYAEIRDDLIRVNSRFRPENDCIEFKFDPDPTQKALTGVVNARLSALDSLAAENSAGVDNLYSEGFLDSLHITQADYSRRIMAEGYAVEMRLEWAWLSAGDKRIRVGTGQLFGIGINIHDNDSDNRDGSINWSAGRSDDMWLNPLLLGTAILAPDHRIQLIKRNNIDPNAAPGMTYLSYPLITLRKNGMIRPENWFYHAGDDSGWADPGFDHGTWELVCAELRAEQMPASGWEGIGWFRVWLEIDTSIVGRTVGFNMLQIGASEVYLDGQRIFRFGRVVGPDSSEQSAWQRNPRFLTFRRSGPHLLAVRYSNVDHQRFHDFSLDAGFEIGLLPDLAMQIDNRINVVRIFSLYQMIFFVIPLAFGIIHILLFAFYPRAREHLYFSISMFCWAVIIFTDFHAPMVENFDAAFMLATIRTTVIPPAIIFSLLVLYQSLYNRIPKMIYVMVTAGVVLMIWAQINMASRILSIGIYVLIGLGALEVFRLIIVSAIHGWRGRWITLVGFVCFMIALSYQILSNFGILPQPGEYGITYVYGLLILAISASIDLSRDFALTNRDLETKLEEVKTLSKKALEQEQRFREEEIARKLLEADNARKTKELEEARQLQLSMLPRKIPNLPHLEIAALMKTATEVGGDYYDFYSDSNGTLTVAIGDATGHGMKAGTMVAAIKSLFAAFSRKLNIPRFFERCTEIIRDMHLGNIYMAMMIARINGGTISVSAAGMPPLFVYRAEKGEVEEIVIKGMPLGAHLGLTYKLVQSDIHPGDTLLFMTDGYAELFNDKKEVMDYPRVREVFKAHAKEAPQAVIDHLLRAGESWQNGQQQQDDFTFIVIKYVPVNELSGKEAK